MRRWQPTGADGIPLTALGVDVAHGGGDRTVLSRRYRNWFAPLQKIPGNQTPDGQTAAGFVKMAIARPADCNATVNIDSIGYGSSCWDFCKEDVPGATAVNYSEATIRKDKAGVLHFCNLRAWAYWSLREALDPHRGEQLALPPDQELLAELTAGRWEMLLRGVKIEDKDDITLRLGRSPDCADAVVLAHLQMPKFDPPPPPDRGRDDRPRTPFHGIPRRSAAEEYGLFGRGGGPRRRGPTVFHR
jgi:hypothetical protein